MFIQNVLSIVYKKTIGDVSEVMIQLGEKGVCSCCEVNKGLMGGVFTWEGSFVEG